MMDTKQTSARDPSEASHAADAFRPRRHSALLAITTAGFTSALAQIVTVRELLVLFYGNELSSGLVFTSWLLWTALGSGVGGRYSRRIGPTGPALALVLLLLALVLPATLLWIRATRLVWSIPMGELLPPVKMFAIALTTTGPLCSLGGFLFALAWAVQTRTGGGAVARPLWVYLGEAAGAAAGGLCLYFALLPHTSVLLAVLLNALLLLLAAAVLIFWSMRSAANPNSPKRAPTADAPPPRPDAFPPRLAEGEPVAIASSDSLSMDHPPKQLKLRRHSRFVPAVGLWLIVALGLAAAMVRVEALDHLSRRWQWGAHLLAVYDTPYHHLAVVQQANQMSVFANGLWWFSTPDPQTAEYAVHVALLEHPQPRKVLVMGSGIAGMLDEVLKHPSVEYIDYVEADPEVIPMLAAHLSGAAASTLHDPRVHLFYVDAGAFVQRTQRHYDVILLNIGDPMNLQINRFYTVEFYRRISRILEADGIVSFAVGASADIVGPVQARFLRSLYVSLQAVFSEVLIFPGDNARFLATSQKHLLSIDARQLAERIRERGLTLQYVREDTLYDALNPFRLQALAAVLAPAAGSGAAQAEAQPNRDFVPICYYHNLLLWAAQLHGGILQGMLMLERYKAAWLWAGGLVYLLGVGLLVKRGRSRSGTPVGFNVLVVGGVLMGTEIVLLLAFQVFAGFVYRQVALIIALFMVGMASGAALVSRVADRHIRAGCWLLACQGGICVFLVALVFLLQVLQNRLDTFPQTSADVLLTAVFAVLAVISGSLGGMHFSLATRVLAGNTVASEKIGGGLYGLDLLGAASGALITSLFLVPLYGLLTTLYLFAGFTGIGMLALAPKVRDH
jgi:spermidine synthase